jgi:predicted PurR-regulated permease PerM
MFLIRHTIEWLDRFDLRLLHNYLYKLANIFQNYNVPVQIVIPSLHRIQGALEITNEPFPLISSDVISINIIDFLRSILYKSTEYIRAEFTHIVVHLQGILSKIFVFIFRLMLIFVISIFILVDANSIIRSFFRIIPLEYHAFSLLLINSMNKGIVNILIGQISICLINSVLTLIGLLVLDIDYAFLLSSIAGLLSFIPIFGSIISTIPIVIVAITKSIATSMWAIVWIFFIHSLEANLLNPKIIGSLSKLHPTLVILSLVIGEYKYGIIGALIAIPLAITISTLINILINWINNLDV